MTQTPLLQLPYIAENDTAGHVPHNAALDTIDGIIGYQKTAAASLSLRLAEVELTGLSGASVTAAALIPDRAIVLGVTSWVPSGGPAITGAPSYSVGLSVGASEFGSGLGIAAGSRNRGVIGPIAVYADTDVVVTSDGADFTGGTLRLAAAFILPEVTP